MSIVEEIKYQVLASLYHRLGWSRVPDLRNILQKLSVEQRANLAQYALQLKAFMEQQGDTSPDPELLELACLIPGALRGKPSFMADQSPKTRSMFASELTEAGRWLLNLEAMSNAVRTLIPDQRQYLFSTISPALNAVKSSDSTSKILFSMLDAPMSAQPFVGPFRFDVTLCKDWEQLSAQEADEIASFAISLAQIPLPNARDEAEELLLYIASLLPDALKGRHYELATHHVFSYRGVLYYNADPATSELLITRLDNSQDPDNLNVTLVALAWIGDANVRSAFRRWDEQPPLWRDQLYIPPSGYAIEAGWELTTSGERYNLTFDSCRRLLSTNQSSGPVNAFTPASEKCGHCEQNLITLLDLDLSSPDLSFLGITGKRLRISTCDNCGPIADAFLTNIDLEGMSEWSNLNQPPSNNDYEPYYSAASRTLVLSSQPSNPLAAIACDEISQLGGYPAWVQDAAYPVCGKCGQTMLFLGQISTQDFMGEPSEGTTY